MRDRTEEPEGVEEPETAREPDEPETAREPDEPETAREPDEPETGREPEEPEEPEEPDEPETAREPEEPETAREPEDGAPGRSGAGAGARPGVRHWLPTAVIGALLAVLLLAWGGWLVSGGSLEWVSSPSMGTAIPEGSLVASQPVTTGQPLRVGEMIVFREPGTTTVFVHRVVRVFPGGRYLTKGDLERTPDPWVVVPSDVIGSVRASIPAIGWIYRSAMWLFLGSAVLLTTSMFVGRRTRRWLRLVGPVVLLAIPLLRYRPLVEGTVLGTGQHGSVGTAHIVDSGVLPVHFTMPDGRSVYGAPGQAVDVAGRVPAHGTGPADIPIHIAAALPWWGWTVVVLICLSPLAALELDVRRARRAGRAAAPADGRSSPATEELDAVAAG